MSCMGSCAELCRAAAAKSGVTNVQFIEEGVAAALAHNVGQDPESCHNATIVVYDAGAHKACACCFSFEPMPSRRA